MVMEGRPLAAELLSALSRRGSGVRRLAWAWESILLARWSLSVEEDMLEVVGLEITARG